MIDVKFKKTGITRPNADALYTVCKICGHSVFHFQEWVWICDDQRVGIIHRECSSEA